MKGMRKRRWWFAGLALALFAASVGLWKWSEPSFRFMQGAVLVSAGPPMKGFHLEIWASTKPTEVIRELARPELRARYGKGVGVPILSGKVPLDGGAMWVAPDESSVVISNPRYAGPSDGFKPDPRMQGTASQIMITRRSNAFDALRMWLRRLRGDPVLKLEPWLGKRYSILGRGGRDFR
jgi:hypothetical protein